MEQYRCEEEEGEEEFHGLRYCCWELTASSIFLFQASTLLLLRSMLPWELMVMVPPEEGLAGLPEADAAFCRPLGLQQETCTA